MKCPGHDILSIYLDGEVLFPWNDRIREHLGSCDSCRKAYEELLSLQSLLQEVEDPDPEEAKLRVRNEITRLRERGRTTRRRIWKKSVAVPVPLFAAAAVFTVVFSFIAIFVSMRPRSENIAGDGTSVELLIEGKDPEDITRLLEVLDESSTPDEVIITLPEGYEFHRLGEPELLKEVDYRKGVE